MHSTGGEMRCHCGRPAFTTVRGRDVDSAATDADGSPCYGRLARRDVRQYFEQSVAKLGIDSKLLMYDGPQHSISAPCLLKRRTFVEWLIDVRDEVWRRANLRHHARLLFDWTELELCQIVGIALLLTG